MYIKWIILGLAVLMYLFVIIFQDKKVWFTTAAALITIVLGFVFMNQVFSPHESPFALFDYIFTSLINFL